MCYLHESDLQSHLHASMHLCACRWDWINMSFMVGSFQNTLYAKGYDQDGHASKCLHSPNHFFGQNDQVLPTILARVTYLPSSTDERYCPHNICP